MISQHLKTLTKLTAAPGSAPRPRSTAVVHYSRNGASMVMTGSVIYTAVADLVIAYNARLANGAPYAQAIASLDGHGRPHVSSTRLLAADHTVHRIVTGSYNRLVLTAEERLLSGVVKLTLTDAQRAKTHTAEMTFGAERYGCYALNDVIQQGKVQSCTTIDYTAVEMPSTQLMG